MTLSHRSKDLSKVVEWVCPCFANNAPSLPLPLLFVCFWDALAIGLVDGCGAGLSPPQQLFDVPQTLNLYQGDLHQSNG